METTTTEHTQVAGGLRVARSSSKVRTERPLLEPTFPDNFESAERVPAYELGLWKRMCRAGVLAGLRAYQRTMMKVDVCGRERIRPGPKIYVLNHISAFDPLWTLPVFPEPVHFVLGPPYAVRWISWLWSAYHQINALPRFRKTVIDECVNRLRAGKAVAIFPEGDLQDQFELGHFYAGAAKIYLRYPVPLIPLALAAPVASLREYPFPTIVNGETYRCVVGFRGPLFISVGKPFMPSRPNATDRSAEESIMHELKERILILRDQIRDSEDWPKRR